MPDSDIDLMLRCKGGDRSALEELVKRYEEPLMNFLYRLSGDLSAAEDLFQETFLRVIRSSAKYEPKAAFSTWLYTIARNLAIDRFKKRSGLPQVSMDGPGEDRDARRLADLPDGGRTPLEDVDAAERAQIVRGALAQLSDKKREVLMMRVYLGMPYAEIAEIVGAPLGTVKYRIHDALKDLSEIMGALSK
jgi:RNA polymerase sigma-70 factor (ECF subfamily)